MSTTAPAPPKAISYREALTQAMRERGRLTDAIFEGL